MPADNGPGNAWIAFVVLTILSWGSYVPILHEGQKLFGGGNPGKGGLRAFICVGLAYTLVAAVLPLILLFTSKMEDRSFSASASMYSLVAGVLGAAGALGIILAIKFGGKPLSFVPLIFAGAPIISTFVSIAWHSSQAGKPAPGFYMGIVLAAVGAGMVLWFRPDAPKPPGMKPAEVVSPSEPKT